MIRLKGRGFTRSELLHHVGRLEQPACAELFEITSGSERDERAHLGSPHCTHEIGGRDERYAELPTSPVGYGSTWAGDDCALWAEGGVRRVAIFGKHLPLLWCAATLRRDSDRVTL